MSVPVSRPEQNGAGERGGGRGPSVEEVQPREGPLKTLWVPYRSQGSTPKSPCPGAKVAPKSKERRQTGLLS